MTTKTAFVFFLTAVLIFAAGTASGKYSGGTGEIDAPYRIASAADLQVLTADANDFNKAFVLVNDIDLSEVSMTPIGNNVLSFTGIFDGNDHIIRNITINTPSNADVGLFGYIGIGGEVKNLGIVDANFQGAGDVGGLSGYNNGSITSCCATGVVDSLGAPGAGGLVGFNYHGTITSCYTTCSVSGGDLVGGLTGVNYGVITSCYATGAVGGNADVSGLTGFNGFSGIITSCYSTGAVSGSTELGGLVGRNDAPADAITACFWDVNTSGQTSSAGGTGKTTAEMQTLSTFIDSGWDFAGEMANGTNDIWTMPFDGGYPMLSWENTVTIGTGEGSWAFPFYSYDFYLRTQTIYLASEIGGKKTLRSLALNVALAGGSWMQNFTIRVKHTNLASYASNLWETSGWTTVYQSDLTVSEDGWLTFVFDTPFEYNGIDNLMVDMSFNYSNGAWSSFCYYSVPGGNRTISNSTNNSSYNNPLAWSGSSPTPFSDPYVPNIRLGFIPVPTVDIPNVVGMTQADANTAIIAAGLVIGAITTDYSDTVTAGNVISQSPAAGTSVELNSAVDFVVSLGVENVNVPDIVGLTEADAASAITSAGFVVGDITYDYSDSIVRSSIISQDPAAGTNALPGSAVDIVISLGRWMDITVTKCTVAAGSKYNIICDSISFSGVLDANDADILAADQIVVTVVSDEPMDPCVLIYPINTATFKKGSYSYTIKGSPFSSSFKFSTKTKAFSLSAKNINLTGLDCPVTISIRIGNSLGHVVVDETIVNGIKKLIPYQLMMDVRNSLVADKVSVKLSPKPAADSFKISGRFTASAQPDLGQPLVITVGNLTFTVSPDKFLSKNGVVSCKNAVVNEGPLVRITAKLDYVKCTFTISVKYASIIQSGVVDFGIDCFGVNLDGLETINLGQI